MAAVSAYHLAIDPARTLQTLPVRGVLPPKIADRFKVNERDILLNNGISTYNVDSGSQVRLERVITAYRKNPAGAIDESYLDITTHYLLGALRSNVRSLFQLKYPRHKLGKDGTNYAPGSAIITPKVARAEIINLFREWEFKGWVEDANAFVEGLIVEQGKGTDRNTLELLLPPNLIGNLLGVKANIQFIL